MLFFFVYFKVINFLNHSLYSDSTQIIKKMLFFIFCTLILVEKFKYAHSIQIFINSNYPYHISTTLLFHPRQPAKGYARPKGFRYHR